MSYLKSVVIGSVFALLVVAVPASAQTVVEVAQSDDTFSSLVEAVVAQDLVETLNSDGPFTVFAPTNDAFASIPTYINTLLGENPELLTEVLLYHVVPGELMAADVLASETLETAQGEAITVSADGGAFVDESAIIVTDVAADNGVIHAIDTVMLPEEIRLTIYRALVADLVQLTAMLSQSSGGASHTSY